MNTLAQIDEQEQTDAFERLCGSVARAQQLLRLYTSSYPCGGKSKQDVYRHKAKRDGFTCKQIDTLLLLQ